MVSTLGSPSVGPGVKSRTKHGSVTSSVVSDGRNDGRQLSDSSEMAIIFGDPGKRWMLQLLRDWGKQLEIKIAMSIKN